MPIVCVGDLHIKSKTDKHFEYHRIEAFTQLLEDSYDESYTLALLGDVFDSNNIRPEDIKLFYSMIDRLSAIFKRIMVIDGNHDSRIFHFLPQTNFTYFSIPTTVDDVLLVPWSYIHEYTTALTLKQPSSLTLMTHARCTIEPLIKEEVDFSMLSSKFKQVILGDIHMPYNPYPNVYYTSEPMQHSYKSYSKNSTGFIVLEDDGSIKRVFTELPRKEKLEVSSISELDELIPTLDKNNRYKIIVTEELQALQKIKKLNYEHIKFELIPKVALQSTNAEELKDMVNQKLSIEDLLFTHIQKDYKFDSVVISKVYSRLRGIK